ncbi:MAG TPA: DUF4156 domain-containing protein [Gammaproteobacteria bacterium]|nr:DUF4156 domain-containing protein [Gammaproteobacteria bacterium]
MRAKSLLALVLTLAVGDCTWVSVSPEAQQHGVIALSLDRVANCRQLSQIQVSVANTVGVFKRMPSDVEHDLTNLAINEAAKSDADTVAALSPVKDGAQTFGIYQCLKTRGQRAAAPAASTHNPAVKTTPYRPPLG